jgi:hypothetical protein
VLPPENEADRQARERLNLAWLLDSSIPFPARD